LLIDAFVLGYTHTGTHTERGYDIEFNIHLIIKIILIKLK